MMVAVDILMHHPAAADAGADDRAGGDQGSVVVAMQLSDQLAHGRRFDIEATDGVTLHELLPDQRVPFEFPDVVDVDIDLPVGFNQLDTFADMTQTPLAEYVELVEADILGHEHIHHGGGEPFGRQMDGAPGGQRLFGDEDAAGMDAEAGGKILQQLTILKDGAGDPVAVMDAAFGQLIDLRLWQAEDLTQFANDRVVLEGGVHAEEGRVMCGHSVSSCSR